MSDSRVMDQGLRAEIIEHVRFMEGRIERSRVQVQGPDDMLREELSILMNFTALIDDIRLAEMLLVFESRLVHYQTAHNDFFYTDLSTQLKAIAQHLGASLTASVLPPPATPALSVAPAPVAPASAPAPVAAAPEPVAAAPEPLEVPPAPAAPAAAPSAPAAVKAPAPKAEAAKSGEEGAGETVRVNVGLLSSLMDLVGELVLTKNQLHRASSAYDDNDLNRVSQRLGFITSELQNEVMKTRMQPVASILTKFQRLVRDTAKELGKNIELKLEGVETELDRTLIEAVKDPLTHIVRNSIDHGLERPEDRLAAGKNEQGKITIRAYQENGRIIIEVKDDGRGLDVSRIAKKAIEKKLVTEEAIARMSEKEVQNLIFLPGFSTAEAVSSLSGRGVGMDVVRTNIEQIGGVIDLNSVFGEGMTIRLKIPLTLAIIPALLIRSAGQSFAIPQAKLVELLRLEKQGANAIEYVQGVPVYRLRGKMLPLVSLKNVLDGDNASGELEGESFDVVVLDSDGSIFGLIVDSIEDSADIVTKPLPSFLKHINVYSGASIMGDGSIAITLDVNGIADRSGMNAVTQERFQETPRLSSHVSEVEYLVLDLGLREKYALPLCVVSRLEEVPAQTVRYSGSKAFIPYRDGALRLIDVRSALNLEGDSFLNAEIGTLAVVVVRFGGMDYGLVVKGIADLITTDASLDVSMKDRPGLMGALIGKEAIHILLDAFELVQGAGQGLKAAEITAASLNAARPKVLVVDDGSFFRKYLAQLLQPAGFDVTVAAHGGEALKILEQAGRDEYQFLLTDMEMPEVDGIELIRRIRAQSQYADMKIVGTSAAESSEAQAKMIGAGADAFIPKSEVDQLVAWLNKQRSQNKGGIRAA